MFTRLPQLVITVTFIYFTTTKWGCQITSLLRHLL